MAVEYLLHESSVGYAVSYILRTYEGRNAYNERFSKF
jgi:hypothetical protein